MSSRGCGPAAGAGGEWRRSLRVAALVSALVAAAPAVANEAKPADADGLVAASTRAMAAGWAGMLEGAATAWDATAAAFLPAPPAPHLPDQMPPRTRAFIALMDEAGYRVSGIETGGMLLSHVRYQFVQERRLTAEDAERARNAIARHQARHSGISAAIHRWVAESVVEAALSKDYRVAAVDVTLRPLPSLTFQTVAVDRPLLDGERRLVRELRAGENGGAQ